VLSHLTPRLGTWSFADNDRELFRKTAYPAFDTVSAAETAADLTFDVLLHPQRAARLVEFHRRDSANPSLEAVMSRTLRKVMSAPKRGRTAEIGFVIKDRYASALMDLMKSDVSPAVKATARGGLNDLALALSGDRSDETVYLRQRIEAFMTRPVEASKATRPAKALPPGSPIGSE